jgi:hypothetical protein
MSADWCSQIVQEAIERHGKPEILNSDQGSQFTRSFSYRFEIRAIDHNRKIKTLNVNEVFKAIHA